jgi:hypothetical protein
MINDIETVQRIRGTYAGGGMASIGPVYDWETLEMFPGLLEFLHPRIVP